VSGANSSAFIIGGMPFNSKTSGYTAGAVDIGFGGIKGTYSRVEAANDTIGFYYPSENTGVTRSTLAGNQIGNGYIIVTISYETDS